MRSARGYLDTLVRSAGTAPAVAGVRAVRRPKWRPTRLPESADETEHVQPPTRRAHVPATTPRAAPSADPPSAPQTPDAPTTLASAPISPSPEPRLKNAATHIQKSGPVEAPTARRVTEHTAEPHKPAPPAATPTVITHVTVPPPAQTRQREVVGTPRPRLPAGTEAALERLEHLARRFSSTRPVEDARPAPVAAPPRPSTVERTDHRFEPRPIAIAPEPTTVPRAADPPRVEIGSIEVFVTQPATPTPVAAPVAPSRMPVAAPVPPTRLSRPLHPYGFGQG